MNTETETLVNVLRSRMEKMTPNQRINILESLTEGYCKHCGSEQGEWRCQCWNDE